MCGLAGFFSKTRMSDIESVLRQMLSKIHHRGPDSDGVFIENGVALGHKRLAIIDLSPSGHQPMMSADQRFVLSYNGEIYNFPTLREELMSSHSCSFQGSSDTEVLLKGIEVWGLEETLKKIKGMFAFALYDKMKKLIYLARDRTGQKPLYFYQTSGHFIFGSEPSVFKSHPFFPGKICSQALAQFFKYNCIPAPFSIYSDTFKVLPGTFLTFDIEKESVKTQTYFSMRELSAHAKQRPFENYQDALDELERSLEEVISEQMVTDVPFGVFLSGGIDSSLVASLMQKQSSSPIESFSIGFHEKGYDEAPFAAKVAKHLGTKHYEHYLSAAECLQSVEKMGTIYSEPFSDSSQIPTYLVSKFARNHVKVCLTGDGGDEFFAGYNRHVLIDRLWKLKMKTYPWGEQLLTNFLSVFPQEEINQFGNFVFAGRYRSIGYQLTRANTVIGANSHLSAYDSLVSHFSLDSEILKKEGSQGEVYQLDDGLNWNAVEQFQYFDQMNYLPSDILAKVDRASMANSLETRAPLIDQRIIATSWRFPTEMKVRNGKGKWPLRDLLSRYVPVSLYERPKVGFGIPLNSWMRHELKDWAWEYLKKDSIDKSGLLNYAPIERLWEEHQSGAANHQFLLWDVLMFQQWFFQHID